MDTLNASRDFNVKSIMIYAFPRKHIQNIDGLAKEIDQPYELSDIDRLFVGRFTHPSRRIDRYLNTSYAMLSFSMRLNYYELNYYATFTRWEFNGSSPVLYFK